MLSMIKQQPVFAVPYIPSELDSVAKTGPAASIGLKKGDRLLKLNNHDIEDWGTFNNEIGRLQDVLSTTTSHKDSLKVRTVNLTYSRKNGASVDTITQKVVLTPDLLFGFYQSSLKNYYKPTHDSYGFWDSFPAGIKYGWNVLKGYVGNLKYLFSSEGAKSLGGFGSIGSLFPSTWDWHIFWNMTAFLSIILAFMNILPIPALDGGHVLFLIYEMITRRKPSEQFMIWAEYIGIAIVILLMVVANLNDILRLFHII